MNRFPEIKELAHLNEEAWAKIQDMGVDTPEYIFVHEDDPQEDISHVIDPNEGRKTTNDKYVLPNCEDGTLYGIRDIFADTEAKVIKVVLSEITQEDY